MINLLFLWHLHQPNYRHAATGEYILPWVRLHSAKGYLDLLSILQRYESARSVVNFSGILLEQLMEYQHGNARDKYEVLSSTPVDNLEPEDREFVVRYFFSANRDHMIMPHLRYRELYAQRQDLVRLEGYAKAAELMSDQDITDLMVWFNLAWIGFTGRRRPDVLELLKRARGYTNQEQLQVLAIHRELAGQVLTGYRELAATGRIELSLTPYHHPILPLLHDCEGVGSYNPDDPLPAFQYPEDAAEQIRRGMAFYQQAFGCAPVGAWPAEGSVSDAALQSLANAGLRWAATDQQNLPMQVGTAMPHLKPYRWRQNGSEIVMFFRDTRLADNIGFEYASWQPARAGSHLVEMTLDMGRRCQCGNPVITVALDGENPWETYPDGGQMFLSALFERIAQQPDLECRTARELIHDTELPQLEHVHAGSWIGGNFNIWSGHAEDKLAWRRLAKARRDLVDVCQGKVYDCLLAAEGSDWFWWYGDEFTTEEAAQFDELFRTHLITAYQAAERAVPDELYTPIISDRHPEMVQEVHGLSEVILDGRVTDFFEWRNAIKLNGTERQSAMARSAAVMPVEEAYYGFTNTHLVLRFDFTPEWLAAWRKGGGQVEVFLTQQEQSYNWSLPMLALEEFEKIQKPVIAQLEAAFKLAQKPGSNTPFKPPRIIAGHHCVVDRIAEVAIDLDGLQLQRGAVAHFWAEFRLASGLEGRVPGSGPYPIRVIAEDFSARNWWV